SEFPILFIPRPAENYRIRSRTLLALLVGGGRFAEAQPCRMPGGFGARGNTELAVDVLDIARHGILRDPERLGHLAIAKPPADQAKHLALASRQVVFRRGRPGSLEMLHDPARDRRRERGDALGHLLELPDQQLLGLLFEQISLPARRQRAPDPAAA